MMRIYILLALIALAQSIGLGATVYNNTVTDTGDTLFFSVAPYSEIGDVIQVSGTERFATGARVQFFNGGTSGAFDTTLRMYALGLSSGSPVGGQIGSDYMVKNQTAPELASFDIAFNMINVMVPSQFVFTVSVTNVVGGADLGLNLFDPPTVGSSDNAFLITRDANGFSESTVPGNDANPYFQMTASDVISPEPSTMVQVALALMGVLLGRGRAARSGARRAGSALVAARVAVSGLLLPAIPRFCPGPSVGGVDGGRCGKESGVMTRYPGCSKPRASGFRLALARNSGQVAFRYVIGCLPPMALLCVLYLAAHAASPPTSWTLVWADEFNGPANSAPDPTKWKFDLGATGWGNHELERYTDSTENAFLDTAGHLVIRAVRGGDGTFTSARLKTEGRFTFTYGKVEARIRIPHGKGVWPAFWMLGSDIAGVGWPRCGEIDIMENVGHEMSTLHGTVHGPGYSGAKGVASDLVLPGGRRLSGDFHTYGVEWRSDSVRFFFDGAQYAGVAPASLPPGARWVFDHPFYLILNLAIGGDWPGNPDSTTEFPQEMVVDWVRVSQPAAQGGKAVR